MEPLSRPEVPDGRESGSSGVRDEVVIGRDDFGGEQSGNDGQNFLNGDLVSHVDPSFVEGFLDRPEEFGIRMVQA